MQSVNPFTGEVLCTIGEHSSEEVQHILEQVDDAFQHWKNSSFSHRSRLMKNLQELLRHNREELAALIVSEMGKVNREALAEIDKCALTCGYYAENAEAFLAPEPVLTGATESWVAFRPIGTILAVMPWNFPFWQVFRFLAPTLMAGNTGVLKHASSVPGCSLAIEKLVQEAGFPENVFRSLLIGSGEVNEVIAHPLVKAVTLTGSTPAGRSVASAAGHALKKSVLELGGSDPYLVFEDANVAEAARICTAGRLLNAGQSCIGAKRFIVADKIYEDFRNEFTRCMSEATFGNPMDPSTTIGPLSSRHLRDELHLQVVESRKMGARVTLGGYVPEGKGAFYPPTILEEVVPGMPAYHEELFGPVAVLYRFRTTEEAVKLANDTVFGLGAAIFTSDPGRARELAENSIEAGCVFVNDFVKSDPRLPFGGIRESGYGRELSAYGLREFVNIKTIVVK